MAVQSLVERLKEAMELGRHAHARPDLLEEAAERVEELENAFLLAIRKRWHTSEDISWQPIESAPRDGTPFLGYCANVKWHPKFRVVMFTTSYHAIYGDKDWWAEWDGTEISGLTHWMPLPEAPE